MKDGSSNGKCLYIFLDEAGNLDFSAAGTRYFILSGITKERPFFAYRELTELKYNLVEQGVSIEYFHAAVDNQSTRNQVYDIIEKNLDGVIVDAVLVEKARVVPEFHLDEHFYPKVLGTLLREILAQHPMADFREVIVFTDRIPINRKRAAIEKAVKMTLSTMLPTEVRYRVHHHESKSNMDLQIADYCTWAIYRKWSRKDIRSYKRVEKAIRIEWDLLADDTEFGG
jgi:hypothetical protein